MGMTATAVFWIAEFLRMDYLVIAYCGDTDCDFALLSPPKVADGFLTMLFNDSLLQGFGLTFLFSCIFLTGGWLFTRRQTI